MSDARFGPEYPKINGVFKRDMADGGVIIPGEFSEDEFTYLLDNEWTWTEKVDGTNIRLHFDGDSITVGGRTDSAQIPGTLMFALAQFNNPALWNKVFPLGEDDARTKHVVSDIFGLKSDPRDITVYGEGYGPKIQNGGRYRSEPAFVVFDIRVGRWWLKREDVVEAAGNLGMSVVPIVAQCSLREAISLVHGAADGSGRDSLFSSVSVAEEFTMEGLVGTPSIPLFSRNGSRIIAKLKIKDFEDLAKRSARRGTTQPYIPGGGGPLSAQAAYEEQHS